MSKNDGDLAILVGGGLLLCKVVSGVFENIKELIKATKQSSPQIYIALKSDDNDHKV